ncbi:N-acetylmannosamine kinase [Vibrio anguillarum]|uniref:N-acetylmannosamine kinase n=15 Tax=Vibrio anguillarum TaxID=55601 RepID=A0A289GAG7_VIBAN|nr:MULTISPECIES: N-acetylmannosamine kinase [Vibrio]ASW80376.1 N-acetylmannosamine kinase [Vibrio anguillarum]AZS25598.1 ROK family protein [Vibrio anguillarum]MBF4222568.1 ROK family protein [Vibrio anguillarum]MBF4242142.1 ROK family protein [Vibrio anguillarum]MBF4274200.1 ROK family protein [Vibrio anguillarum]
MHTLAIDIGGTKIALAIVEDDIIIQRYQMATPVVQDVIEFVQAILEKVTEWIPSINYVGVSTTGYVTPEGITSINPETLNFPVPFPLAKTLEQLTNKPVSILNDAQAAAWFEFVQLKDPTLNMAFITVSTGVGGGIIIGGKLHKGNSGLAGHIGHMSVAIEGPLCGCGQRGCVESIASGNAIQKESEAIFIEAMSNIELFQQAAFNPRAEAIINRSVQAVATLCCNLKACLDLDMIVLGGGIGLAGGYLGRLNKAIQSRPSVFHVPVTPAHGDYDACLLGAAFQFKE